MSVESEAWAGFLAMVQDALQAELATYLARAEAGRVSIWADRDAALARLQEEKAALTPRLIFKEPAVLERLAAIEQEALMIWSAATAQLQHWQEEEDAVRARVRGLVASTSETPAVAPTGEAHPAATDSVDAQLALERAQAQIQAAEVTWTKP